MPEQQSKPELNTEWVPLREWKPTRTLPECHADTCIYNQRLECLNTSLSARARAGFCPALVHYFTDPDAKACIEAEKARLRVRGQEQYRWDVLIEAAERDNIRKGLDSILLPG